MPDRTGEPRARIYIPKRLDIVDIRGDLVLGVSLDEFDVPNVLLYHVEERTPESGFIGEL